MPIYLLNIQSFPHRKQSRQEVKKAGVLPEDHPGEKGLRSDLTLPGRYSSAPPGKAAMTAQNRCTACQCRWQQSAQHSGSIYKIQLCGVYIFHRTASSFF